MKSKATKLADSIEDLCYFTQRYLADPNLERKERAAFAEAMCHKVDGKSAQRISSLLLDVLDGRIAPVVSSL